MNGIYITLVGVKGRYSSNMEMKDDCAKPMNPFLFSKSVKVSLLSFHQIVSCRESKKEYMCVLLYFSLLYLI